MLFYERNYIRQALFHLVSAKSLILWTLMQPTLAPFLANAVLKGKRSKKQTPAAISTPARCKGNLMRLIKYVLKKKLLLDGGGGTIYPDILPIRCFFGCVCSFKWDMHSHFFFLHLAANRLHHPHQHQPHFDKNQFTGTRKWGEMHGLKQAGFYIRLWTQYDQINMEGGHY